MAQQQDIKRAGSGATQTPTKEQSQAITALLWLVITMPVRILGTYVAYYALEWYGGQSLEIRNLAVWQYVVLFGFAHLLGDVSWSLTKSWR